MKILITGGASGLGKSITETLAKAGHEIVITYCHSEQAALSLEKAYAVQSIQCDFKDEKSVQQLVEQISDLGINVLINNALTGLVKKHFHRTKAVQFQQSFLEDVLPTILITQAAIKTFRKEKFGKIITILSSSIIGNPPIGWSMYSANKAYLLAMSKSWATENAKQNITANCISPAFMQTSLNEEEDERIIENMTKGHPLNKLLQVEEVAETVSYLVHATQHINGVNIPINAAENIQ